MMKRFEQMVEDAKNMNAYKCYLRVRPLILRMLEEAEACGTVPSDYWTEELAGFEYLLDASPLIVHKLREHSYHLTGLLSYPYRSHHSHRSQGLQRKLSALRAIDDRGLFVPESPLLGGFGYDFGGDLCNLDTLKFYETLIALEKAGELDAFRNSEDRRLVVEIGSGWGGFAYQFKKLFPNVTYVCCDLPQSLIFSSIYALSLFPTAKGLIYGECADEDICKQWQDYDFIFLPHYAFQQQSLADTKLGINMVSFQEMTTEQVDQYVRKLSDSGCRAIYSHNRDHSPHNAQLTRVSDVMRRYYDLREVHVLDVPYTNLTMGSANGSRGGSMLANILKRITGRSDEPAIRHEHDYRHLIGRLRGAS